MISISYVTSGSSWISDRPHLLRFQTMHFIWQPVFFCRWQMHFFLHLFPKLLPPHLCKHQSSNRKDQSLDDAGPLERKQYPLHQSEYLHSCQGWRDLSRATHTVFRKPVKLHQRAPLFPSKTAHLSPNVRPRHHIIIRFKISTRFSTKCVGKRRKLPSSELCP